MAVLLLCGVLRAAEIQHVQTMHDKIPIYGTQADSPVAAFDPARSDETLVVEAGQVVEHAGSEIALDILIRGQEAVLRLLPGSSLFYRTITYMDGGKLEGEDFLLVKRNLPIDTGTKDAPGIDPSQYGHGLLGINGELHFHSQHARQTRCQLAAEINAGATQITLASVPLNWQAGDRLVLPDTRQPTSGAELSAQTEVVEIASIDGVTVTLSSPVVYSHLGWHKSDGSLGMLPDVACLTQPSIIRSESATGVRGHVLNTAATHQDVEGVAVVDMGRTTTAVLHSTSRDDQGGITQIGTNQIGRYAWHHHHLLGRRNNGLPWQFRMEHCSIENSPKWGIAIHGTHFGVVNDCCVFNAAGSGIVTEDPWVYGNKITNNTVVAKQPGSGQRITQRAGRNVAGGDHWHDMGGLGLESAMNEITGNRLYCCKESIGMAGNGTASLYYPIERGVCTCGGVKDPNAMAISYAPRQYPFWFDTSDNVAWGGWRGIETWTQDSYAIGATKVFKTGAKDIVSVQPDPHPDMKMFPGYTIVHCALPNDFQDMEETALYGWKILGDWKFSPSQANPYADNATFLYGLNWKGAYRFGITIEDCEVRGYDVAYRAINDTLYVNFNRCKFECPIVFYHEVGMVRRDNRGVDYTLTACEFLPVNGKVLALSGKYPKYDLRLWMATNQSDRRALPPVNYRFRPWRDGHDLDAYHYEQHPSFSLAPIPPDKAYGDLPLGLYKQSDLIAVGKPIFGSGVPATAEQTADFGKFWVNDVTTCERVRELLKKLEGK